MEYRKNFRIYLLKKIISLFLICSIFYMRCTNNKFCTYIFAPGMCSTETQLARYLPKFTASTGEIVKCNRGIYVIDEPVSICKFAELKLKKNNKTVLNPFDIVAYYLTAKANNRYDIKVTKPNNLKSKYSVSANSVALSKFNIGQKEDLNCLFKTYQMHRRKFPEAPIIMYGTSRGAATTFNFLAEYKPENVKAAIIEGTFDTVQNVLSYRYGWLSGIAKKFLTQFTLFDSNGSCPANNVKKIDKELPILLITSEKDESVSKLGVINLYKSLRANGHKKVHILILKNSSHSGYAFDDMQDKKIYQSVVHAFYKYYGLPFDGQLALDEQAFLKITSL